MPELHAGACCGHIVTLDTAQEPPAWMHLGRPQAGGLVKQGIPYNVKRCHVLLADGRQCPCDQAEPDHRRWKVASQ